jgi:transposase-like protein
MSPTGNNLNGSSVAGDGSAVVDWRVVAAKAGASASVLYPASTQTPERPTPEVAQRAKRRTFSVADRQRILAEADACTEPGEIGALLRREGLYSSTLHNFRQQRQEGKLGGDPAEARQARLQKDAVRQRDNRRIAALEAENKKLKVLLDLQKKVAELMHLSLPMSE